MYTDWPAIADLICEVLTKIYVERSPMLLKEAASMGATLEQFAAMAITHLLEERLDAKKNGK
jgi:hypothetical protein